MLPRSSRMSVLCSMVFMPALLSLRGPTKIVRTRKSRAIFFAVFIFVLSLVLVIFWRVRVPLRWPNGKLIFYNTEVDEYDASLSFISGGVVGFPSRLLQGTGRCVPASCGDQQSGPVIGC